MKLKLVQDEQEWKKILLKFHITDIYYQYEYAVSMARHFESDPVLIWFGNESAGFLYVLLIMDISKADVFKGSIPPKVYYDAETPYGYGGPYFVGEYRWEETDRVQFMAQMRNKCLELGIVAQFIRYYPFMFELGKSTMIADKYGTYKSTVCMELGDADSIDRQLDSQYRRKLRKAKESGVVIEWDKGERLDDFMRLYRMTMDAHEADKMYYFKKEYYEYLMERFKEHLIFFYACLEGKTVGASLFLYDENYMHFHLGGRDIHAPKVPFENLLMVEAAKWGGQQGIRRLHLGGGMSDEDSLFQYKKKFNRKGILPFYIGRTIFDGVKYEELQKLRKQQDNAFDMENPFYIGYRF